MLLRRLVLLLWLEVDAVVLVVVRMLLLLMVLDGVEVQGLGGEGRT